MKKLIFILCLLCAGCGAAISTHTFKAIIVSKTFTTTTVRNVKTGELSTYPDVFPENIQDTVWMQDWRFE